MIINFNIKLTIFQRKLTNYDKFYTFSLKMKSQINPNLMNLRKLNSPLIQFLKKPLSVWWPTVTLLTGTQCWPNCTTFRITLHLLESLILISVWEENWIGHKVHSPNLTVLKRKRKYLCCYRWGEDIRNSLSSTGLKRLRHLIKYS